MEVRRDGVRVFDDVARCARRSLPPFVLGANVVEVPDAASGPGVDADVAARGYGSDKARAALARLAADGLRGVVLPVVVRSASLTATTVRRPAPDALVRLARMIDDAHAAGLVAVVVPHLRLDDGGWRGDLAPRGGGPVMDDGGGAANERARAAFLASYATAITPIVDVAERRCAEALSVAVELKSLTRDNGALARFAPLVEGVRARFGGTITYSANWDEVEGAQVWPLVDAVGVNAFFPLADDAAADDEALAARARDVILRLDAVGDRAGKPVWLVEAGFRAMPGSFVEPWRWPTEVAADRAVLDEAAQARAYRALGGAALGARRVTALFFWVVPSDLHDARSAWRFEPRQGFSFVDKAAEGVVRQLARESQARAAR